MTKENDYIWITDEVDASYFSMSAPNSYRSRCGSNRPVDRCHNCKEMNNRIVNENIIQVAVAWAGGIARNRIDSDIDSDDKSGQKEINLCCNGGLLPVNAALEEEFLEDKKKVISREYNFDSLEGDFSLIISKEGEVSINGVKVDEEV